MLDSLERKRRMSTEVLTVGTKVKVNAGILSQNHGTKTLCILLRLVFMSMKGLKASQNHMSQF
jgi:hypothetical protein